MSEADRGAATEGCGSLLGVGREGEEKDRARQAGDLSAEDLFAPGRRAQVEHHNGCPGPFDIVQRCGLVLGRSHRESQAARCLGHSLRVVFPRAHNEEQWRHYAVRMLESGSAGIIGRSEDWVKSGCSEGSYSDTRACSMEVSEGYSPAKPFPKHRGMLEWL